jgi:hypothetical protein
MRTLRLLAVSCALSCALQAPVARAQAPDAEVAARLAFLEARLDAGTGAANRWWYGWFASYGALTLGQYGVALATRDPGLRADAAVGAASSSLGVLGLGLSPFTPSFAAAALRGVPAGTPEERRRKLARAEALLRKGAEDEQLRRGWLAHVAGVGVSLASALVRALAYHRVQSAVLAGVFGVGISELQIFTLPRAAIRDWDAYGKGAWAGAPRASAPRAPAVSFGLAPVPGGVGVAATF